MKERLDKLLLYIGLLLIITSLIILGIYYYLSYSSKQKIINNAEESIINNKTNADNNEVLSQFDEEDLVAIEALDDDQKVDKVTEYKNVIQIPDLKIKANIYDGTDSYTLSVGLGRYTQTKKIGENGNCCVAGHSSVTYDCILNDIDKLPFLSLIFVWDENGVKHTYYIYNKSIVEPTAMYVLNTTDTSRSYFTIITCTDKGRKRLVLSCIEFSQDELEAYKKQLDDTLVNDLLGISKSDVEMFELYDFINRTK